MYDEMILKCFLDKQLQLFPEVVAKNLEEADTFLEDCMAIVVDSLEEVWEYFEEEGTDLEGMTKDDLAVAEEVFVIGDGRFLIVEG